MAFCKYCDNRIDNDSVFCSRCGKQLSGSARQNSPMKYVIPAALTAFIAVMMIINSVSNRSGGRKEYVPPTPPAISISIPPELFNVKPTVELPESTPEPTDEVGDDEKNEDGEKELFENIGDNVVAILSAITGRPDYIYGDFEPLIGVTDVNENGCAEILAVYETTNGDSNEVRCDVWRADAAGADELLSCVLFTEAGGNSGKLHMMRAFTENYYAYYVMFEQNETMGEHFKNSYAFYELSYDETALYYRETFVTEGRYDTEHGGIADADYYINTGTIPENQNPVSADNFNVLLNLYTTIYTLDIISGEYDWDNTLSFDMAWKAFGQD